MMNRSARRILKLGPLLWDIGISSFGCFVFTSRFRSLAREIEGLEMGEFDRVVGPAINYPRSSYAYPKGVRFQVT
jgi:hypothetical protein